MVVAKQMDVRSNIKKYFDMANSGEVIVVSRKQGKNVVIISEAEYNSLSQISRVQTYSDALERAALDHSTDGLKITDVKSDNMTKLKNIASLGQNWNGNGALPFSKALIEKVSYLIQHLPIQPEIFPTALQSIQLEYDNSRHDHIEIEINDSDTADVFYVSYFGQESEETISADIDSISERILQFYG